MKTFAIIPVKRLNESKKRLSTFFKPEERLRLVLSMLEDVLEVTRSSTLHQTVVVGVDPIVQHVAEEFGAFFLSETRRGLNNCLSSTTCWCKERGAEAVLILPVDVPLITAEDIEEIIKISSEASIVVSPSRDFGTNVLMRRPSNVIKTRFGPKSFEKHVREALRKGIATHIYQSPSVSLDIDTEQDLRKLLDVGRGKASYKFLEQSEAYERLTSMNG